MTKKAMVVEDWMLKELDACHEWIMVCPIKLTKNDVERAVRQVADLRYVDEKWAWRDASYLMDCVAYDVIQGMGEHRNMFEVYRELRASNSLTWRHLAEPMAIKMGQEGW